MTAYSFKAQFADPILAGSKGGTIRADRRRHARPGEELQLYTGMRTKHCRLIARKTCIAIEPITLVFDPSWWVRLGTLENHRDLHGKELDRFAQFDGFVSWTQMMRFWAPARNFTGWHIRWALLPWDRA